MSDKLPFEIQIEIMKKLPGYLGLRYVSIFDDDNFPKNMVDLSAILPDSAKQSTTLSLVGSSQGLLCLYDYFRAIIWNPWIRKSVTVTFPNFDYRNYGRVVGFGVCPRTSDPKLVQITFPRYSLGNNTWKVEVFSLSLGFWRISSFNKISDLPCGSFELSSPSECVGGFIYWCASNKDDPNRSWVIISFDLTNEEFGVIYLPDSLARCRLVDLSKHRESLVLFPYDYNIAFYDCDVWMMEGGVTKSFKKLFTINSTNDFVKPLAISYNGEAVLEIVESFRKKIVSSIDTYEPSSKRFKCTTITGESGCTSISSYTETMLLRDYYD
ncbi:F-box/kelch-repeat protein At3g23880-like [Rutidosis leptorrhynchoides]|uniref:F-box/kelch-repeat protein At3g23880-like n=1 Tax=Rutidosis leptorrhynchoides TaxID=125765 RepID=UPI003A994920